MSTRTSLTVIGIVLAAPPVVGRGHVAFARHRGGELDVGGDDALAAARFVRRGEKQDLVPNPHPHVGLLVIGKEPRDEVEDISAVRRVHVGGCEVEAEYGGVAPREALSSLGKVLFYLVRIAEQAAKRELQLRGGELVRAVKPMRRLRVDGLLCQQRFAFKKCVPHAVREARGAGVARRSERGADAAVQRRIEILRPRAHVPRVDSLALEALPLVDQLPLPDSDDLANPLFVQR
jgi:hypothetical protein